MAEIDGKVVGAAWSRIMYDYGHIEEGVPSIAISVDKEYRENGIGTKLMKELLHKITVEKYEKISLSVQKEKYAVELYKKLGFVIVGENDEEYYMVYNI